MAVNSGEIGIYGVLRNDTTDGTLAKTDQLYDDNLEMYQEDINKSVNSNVSSINTSITNIQQQISSLTGFTTKVVDELPETGEENILYLLKDQSTEENNTCYEYVWLVDEGRYELVGSLSVDLTDIEDTLDEHQELLDKISAELWPTTMSVSGGGSVYEIGTTQSVTVRVTITRDDETVTPTSLTINGTAVSTSQTSFTYSVTETTTFSVVAIANGVTLTGSTTVTFVHASYFGAVDSTFTTSSLSSLSVDSLTKSIKNTRSYSNTIALNNQKTIYIYPSSFGTLSAIKDANNFEYLDSYTQTTYTTSNWSLDGSSVSYYVYYLTDATTITSFTQIFS